MAPNRGHARWSLALAALPALALAACGEKEEPEIGDATTTQAGATRTIPSEPSFHSIA